MSKGKRMPALKIDPKRTDVRKIMPPWEGPGFDRPAFYSFEGKYFDAHGREIVPGEPLAKEAADADEEAATAPPGRMGAAALLAARSTMPWAAFLKAARDLLGDTCPAEQTKVLEALRIAAEGGRPAATAARRRPRPQPAIRHWPMPLKGQDEPDAAA
jgi:hypothetical protein